MQEHLNKNATSCQLILCEQSAYRIVKTFCALPREVLFYVDARLGTHVQHMTSSFLPARQPKLAFDNVNIGFVYHKILTFMMITEEKIKLRHGLLISPYIDIVCISSLITDNVTLNVEVFRTC